MAGGTMPLGRLGEELAARFLLRSGWSILARNVRDGPREIDLIAAREAVIAFVEVKTRRASPFGSPLDAIDHRKRRHVRQAAAAWLRDHPRHGRVVRFDAMAVTLGPGGAFEVEHVENAWGM